MSVGVAAQQPRPRQSVPGMRGTRALNWSFHEEALVEGPPPARQLKTGLGAGIHYAGILTITQINKLRNFQHRRRLTNVIVSFEREAYSRSIAVPSISLTVTESKWKAPAEIREHRTNHANFTLLPPLRQQPIHARPADPRFISRRVRGLRAHHRDDGRTQANGRNRGPEAGPAPMTLSATWIGIRA